MPGRTDEIKGSVKETTGRVTGNKRLETEGKTDRAAGKAGREVAGAGNQAGGTLKREAGKLSGNERMHAEGEAQRLKGKAQSAG